MFDVASSGPLFCRKFADIVRCVNGVKLSSECVRDSAKQLSTNLEIACKLNDFQEVCINAPALRTEIDLSAQSLPVGKGESGASYGTGYTVQTTTSPAKTIYILADFSCSLNVIFEVCANISMLDTGDAVETTVSSAEGILNMSCNVSITSKLPGHAGVSSLGKSARMPVCV
ncbi:hypothetical protein C0Q70_12191 [Pomacea canaliculata]|uniref:Uncharacterized protein n=1 Tax=Pomacea canaliculata TaxID=400727 RepID=A0A2T7P0U4_POMCA|nr:hypothetical protein C0Q70_12191 [Pomacea canaliculata]